MSNEPEFPVGTKEYVVIDAASDRSLGGQVVEIRVLGAWLPATWVGTEGLARSARTTSIVDFTSATPGYSSLYGRFTDSPEIPIFYCGQIRVVALAA